MRGSTASFGRSPSSMATGDSTNVAMVGQTGSVGQASSFELSPGVSSGYSALESAPPRGAAQMVEETRASDVAIHGRQDASVFPIPRSVSDSGSTGGEIGRTIPLSNQFDVLGEKKPRSRSPQRSPPGSPQTGQQTPQRTSGYVTPSRAINGNFSERSTPKSAAGSNHGRIIEGADARLERELLLHSSRPGGMSHRSDFPEGPSIQPDLLRSNIPKFAMTPNHGSSSSSPGTGQGGPRALQNQVPDPETPPSLRFATSSTSMNPGGVSPPGSMALAGRTEVSSIPPVQGPHQSMIMVPDNPGGKQWNPNGVDTNMDPVQEAWNSRKAKRVADVFVPEGAKRSITSFVATPQTPGQESQRDQTSYFVSNMSQSVTTMAQQVTTMEAQLQSETTAAQNAMYAEMAGSAASDHDRTNMKQRCSTVVEALKRTYTLETEKTCKLYYILRLENKFVIAKCTVKESRSPLSCIGSKHSWQILSMDLSSCTTSPSRRRLSSLA